MWMLRGLLISTLWLSAGGLAVHAQAFPATHAKTLSGKDVTLPVAGSPMLVLAGFSNASADAETAWWTRAQPLCKANPKLVCLRSAVLEEAPRFIWPMIVGGIRRGTSAEGQDAFLTVFEHESEWKQWFGFSREHGARDYVYVALLDGSGKVLWRGSGGRDAAGFGALRMALQSLSSGQ
jgi:hypothetical protein